MKTWSSTLLWGSGYRCSYTSPHTSSLRTHNLVWLTCIGPEGSFSLWGGKEHFHVASDSNYTSERTKSEVNLIVLAEEERCVGSRTKDMAVVHHWVCYNRGLMCSTTWRNTAECFIQHNIVMQIHIPMQFPNLKSPLFSGEIRSTNVLYEWWHITRFQRVSLVKTVLLPITLIWPVLYALGLDVRYLFQWKYGWYFQLSRQAQLLNLTRVEKEGSNIL